MLKVAEELHVTTGPRASEVFINRASVLIDADAYFKALCAAFEKAQKRIFILGWDIDSQLSLKRSADQQETERYRIFDLLTRLIKQNPQLEVYILCWNYSWIFAHEREIWPWLKPSSWGPRIYFRYDKLHPPMSSHHEKIVLIDDELVFVGGIDLCEGRWDTSDHDPENPLRCDRKNQPYRGFHDMQWMAEGSIVDTVSKHVLNRWKLATQQELKPVKTGRSIWPDYIEPDFVDVEMKMALTVPKIDDQRPVREQYRLTIHWIRHAKKYIYIENQYITSKKIIRALSQRLREPDGPDIVCVMPKKPFSWIDAKTMGVLQFRAIRKLRRNDLYNRLRVCYPRIYPGERKSLYVHAKLLLVDDLFIKIGSTNLNNRSMTFDRECDLYIHAKDEKTETEIRQVRHRILAEHFGLEPSDLPEIESSYSRLSKLVDHRRSHIRSLRRWERSIHRYFLDTLPGEPFFDPYRAPTSFSIARWVINVFVLGFWRARIKVKSKIKIQN